LISFGAAAQAADTACGNPFVNGYGPYDYRSDQQKLKIVEDYHFTPRVESLVGGAAGSVGADLDYTLRAFPNHHRALLSMMNLGAKAKSPMPPGAQVSVECYFRRALVFRPDDAIARMMFATFLARNGRKPEAVREVDFSVQGAPDNAFTQYNAGLIYLEMREFDKALIQAHRALALGFERPNLRQQLQAAGKWVDPPVAPGAASASAVTSVAPAASAASGPLR